MKHKNMPPKKLRYRSYVVSGWQEHSVHAGQEIMVWRFSLQNPRTNQRRGFPNIESLLIALQTELDDEVV
jgi:hypothetical protein